MTEPTTKPFVGAALICERVLEEKNGTLSFIRMIDTFTPNSPTTGLPDGLRPGVEITIVVALRSAEPMQGEVSLLMRAPNARSVQTPPIAAMLAGGINGGNIIFPTVLDAGISGMYWFDVLWNAEVLTSVPLRLAPAPDKQTPATPGTKT